MKGAGALYTLSYFTTIEIIFSAFQNDIYLHECMCRGVSSLDSRPIKIRPGTYCRGDSAHALVYSPESGESPFSSLIYFLSL